MGGLLFVQSIWHRIILSDNEDAARGLYEAIDWAGNRVIAPAAIVVLTMGITMVSVSAWSFSQLWIILALILFAASAFGFGTAADRLMAAALTELDKSEITSDGYRSATMRLIRISRIDGLVTIGILALMVFKPVL